MVLWEDGVSGLLLWAVGVRVMVMFIHRHSPLELISARVVPCHHSCQKWPLCSVVDDTVVLASSDHDLDHVLAWFVAQCKAAALRISSSKSEAMVLVLENGETKVKMFKHLSIVPSCCGKEGAGRQSSQFPGRSVVYVTLTTSGLPSWSCCYWDPIPHKQQTNGYFIWLFLSFYCMLVKSDSTKRKLQ